MHKNARTQQQNKRLAVALVAAFLVATGLLCWLVGVPMVRLASEPEVFRQWIQQRRLGGQLVYVGMVMLQVLAAVIPGEPLEIAGGYAFGAWEGTLLCLIGGTLGSLLVICLVRRFGVPMAELFFSREKLQSVRFLKSSSRRVLLFLLIFMIPGTPKDLLCYFSGLTDIKLPALALICSLGRLPAIVTSTIGGDALGTQSYVFALVVFAVTFLISAAGLLLYHKICKTQNEKKDHGP